MIAPDCSQPSAPRSCCAAWMSSRPKRTRAASTQRANEAVDVFWVRHEKEQQRKLRVSKDEIDLLRTTLIGLLDGKLDRRRADPSVRPPPTPSSSETVVRFIEGQDGVFSTLEVETGDRSGLLLALAQALVSTARADRRLAGEDDGHARVRSLPHRRVRRFADQFGAPLGYPSRGHFRGRPGERRACRHHSSSKKAASSRGLLRRERAQGRVGGADDRGKSARHRSALARARRATCSAEPFVKCGHFTYSRRSDGTRVPASCT